MTVKKLNRHVGKEQPVIFYHNLMQSPLYKKKSFSGLPSINASRAVLQGLLAKRSPDTTRACTHYSYQKALAHHLRQPWISYDLVRVSNFAKGKKITGGGATTPLHLAILNLGERLNKAFKVYFCQHGSSHINTLPELQNR